MGSGLSNKDRARKEEVQKWIDVNTNLTQARHAERAYRSHGVVKEQVLMIRGGVRDRNFAFLWSSWVLGIDNSCSSRDHNLEQHRFRKEEMKGESNPAFFLLLSSISSYTPKVKSQNTSARGLTCVTRP